VLPIRRLPDPILTRPTRAVRHDDTHTERLIQELIATMRHYPHCVGLAAPQVGSDLRVAVLDVSRHPRGAANHGLLVLINPELQPAGPTAVGREGCMSVPDFTGNVARALRVRVRALDRAGRHREWRLEGFEAVAAQHEVDHLDGLLFLDRVANLGTDVFRRKTYR
jgi:peptide deformylase